jgi:hypothetical protein
MSRTNLCVSYKEQGKGIERIIPFESRSPPAFSQIVMPLKNSRPDVEIEKEWE